jgi:hypothetical protein
LKRKWTEEELQFIRDSWSILSAETIADKLNRSVTSVHGKANRLKLKSGRFWTEEEEIYLQDKWGTISIKGIAKALSKSVQAVKL